MSSAYFKKRFLVGLTALKSLTIIENKIGPRTVPCGTPLLISTNFVDSPSTTTLCFRSLRKLIIQLITYGLILYDFSLLPNISCETESKAFLKSNESKFHLKSQIIMSVLQLHLQCEHSNRERYAFIFTCFVVFFYIF